MLHHKSTKSQLGHRRTASKRRCLSQLQANKPVEIFQAATKPLPKFLQNLQCQNDYKAKVFRNLPNCYLQIFTYHYLVLCFESKNNQEAEVFLDYIYELIEKPEFQFILPETNSLLKQYSSMALKNILSQYLNYMSSGTDSVLESLKKYPPILQFFVAFFRTLLFLGQISNSYEDQLVMNNTYEFLASYFNIQLAIEEDYVYFSQSGIYVYQENTYEVYMHHRDDNEEISSFLNNRADLELNKSGYSSVHFLMSNLDQSLANCIPSKSKIEKRGRNRFEKREDKQVNLNQKQSSPFNIKNKSKEQSSLFSKISYNFTPSDVPLSYSNTPTSLQLIQRSNHGRSINEITKFVDNNNIILEEIQIQTKKDLKSEKKLAKHKRHNSEMSQFQLQNIELASYYKEYQNQREKQIENYSRLLKENSYEVSSSKEYGLDLIETADTFYRPTTIMKHVNLEQRTKKTPNVWVNKNITKQFTSSFILQAMPEPYRTSIKAKKQRAREIRKSTSTAFA